MAKTMTMKQRAEEMKLNAYACERIAKFIEELEKEKKAQYEKWVPEGDFYTEQASNFKDELYWDIPSHDRVTERWIQENHPDEWADATPHYDRQYITKTVPYDELDDSNKEEITKLDRVIEILSNVSI